MTRARIALFVLEALPNARMIRRFVADHAADIAFVGLSDAERPSTGGLVALLRQHIHRSGWRFLPYLIVNYGVPDWLRPLAPVTQALTGTRHLPEATPLKTLCRRLDIPTIKIDDVNGPEVAHALRHHTPDLILSYTFDQIFSPETISLARLGGINAHTALLPHHRGPVPTIYAIAQGPSCFGITLHQLAARIDAGAILAQEAVSLPAKVTASHAAVALNEHGRTMLDALLDDIARTGRIPDGHCVPIEPYCPYPSRELLRDLRRRGRQLTNTRDLWTALTLSAH